MHTVSKSLPIAAGTIPSPEPSRCNAYYQNAIVPQFLRGAYHKQGVLSEYLPMAQHMQKNVIFSEALPGLYHIIQGIFSEHLPGAS